MIDTPSPPSPHTPAPTVLDTQAVIDWLYFNDPMCAHWEAARQSGRWQWWSTAWMRAELAHVLHRQHLPNWSLERATHTLAEFDARATLTNAPETPCPPHPRCRDPLDQAFIDLALTLPARWLVSRDKAVLKLRSRMAKLAGVEVLTPAQWQP